MSDMQEVVSAACPACQATLRFAHNIVTNAAGSMLSLTWCVDCGHTLNVQYIGQMPVEAGQSAGPHSIIPN
jgi:uncharacterized Zn finger protein